MTQKHSKYSASQFTSLNIQLDALRLELKKEQSNR
jgi:ABC-type phosphate transport system auxiliary subunit